MPAPRPPTPIFRWDESVKAVGRGGVKADTGGQTSRTITYGVAVLPCRGLQLASSYQWISMNRHHQLASSCNRSAAAVRRDLLHAVPYGSAEGGWDSPGEGRMQLLPGPGGYDKPTPQGMMNTCPSERSIVAALDIVAPRRPHPPPHHTAPPSRVESILRNATRALVTAAIVHANVSVSMPRRRVPTPQSGQHMVRRFVERCGTTKHCIRHGANAKSSADHLGMAGAGPSIPPELTGARPGEVRDAKARRQAVPTPHPARCDATRPHIRARADPEEQTALEWGGVEGSGREGRGGVRSGR